MSWGDVLLAMSNDSQHRDEDPFVCLILSCKCLKKPLAANTAIWQQSAPSSVSQRLLQQRRVFTWRVCFPWHPLDDRCGSRAAFVEPGNLPPTGSGSLLLGMVMERGHEDILHFIWGLFLWYAEMNPQNNTDVSSNSQGMSSELYAGTCLEGNVRKAFRQQQIKFCDLEFN